MLDRPRSNSELQQPGIRIFRQCIAPGVVFSCNAFGNSCLKRRIQTAIQIHDVGRKAVSSCRLRIEDKVSERSAGKANEKQVVAFFVATDCCHVRRLFAGCVKNSFA